MAFAASFFRWTGKPAHQLCIKPHCSLISVVRGFSSLPSVSRSTQDTPDEVKKPKVDNLPVQTRYRKRGGVLIYEVTKRLPYSKKQLYTLIADVEAYPQYLPYCLGSKVISHKALNGSEATDQVNKDVKPWVHGGYAGETYLIEQELVIGFKAFEERYTSQVECRKWEIVKATAGDSPLFKCLTSTWTFRSPEEISTKDIPARDDNLTYISLQLAFAFASPLHAAVGEYFWESVSEKIVQAYLGRIEEVYGKPTHEARESQLSQVGSPQIATSLSQSVMGVPQ